MTERLWSILVDSFPKLLWYGIKVTVPLTIFSFSIALAVALAVALVQYAKVRGLQQLCRFYIWITRGTPLLVQLYIVFFGLPSIGIRLPAFTAAMLVLGFNEGAYMSETIRGALESVSPGQIEAGYCVGLTFPRIMWHVALPQAFRTVLPTYTSEFITLIKETSVASFIAVVDLQKACDNIRNATYNAWIPLLSCAAIYLVLTVGLTKVFAIGEKRFAKADRK